jgi:hypothetical protein
MRSRRTAVLTALFASFALTAIQAQVSVVTQHNDNGRMGQNISETILTPANVNAAGFGKLFSQTVDGTVYAQPLYVPNVSIPGKGTHNVVYVVTEHDSVYAFDADNNSGTNASPLWQVSFIDPTHGITTVSSGDVSCGDLVPEIGVSGTPVIDTVTGTMYLTAKTKENGRFAQRLHALDITTGAEKFGGPVLIKATVKGSGDGSVNGMISFNALKEGQRAGLLLQNGQVYVAWSSHCDNGPYHGWLISFDAATLQPVALWNSTPDGGLGGFWSSGAGIAADSNFNAYMVTGNGTFDVNTHGRDFGDSIIKLPAPTARTFRVGDFFTTFDQQALSDADADVGSGGVMLLPDQTGPHPHILIEAGKQGTIYVVDRDKMGKFNPNNNNQIIQSIATIVGGMWAVPAWWNNTVYFGGSGDYLKAFHFDPVSDLLSTNPVALSGTFYNFPGPTPSISANGNTNGIVWTLQTDNYGSGGSATLHAYDAGNIATELYNTAQNFSRDDPGGSVKFTVPTIANGKVYVPAAKRLTVYGLLGGH